MNNKKRKNLIKYLEVFVVNTNDYKIFNISSFYERVLMLMTCHLNFVISFFAWI